MDAEGKPDSPRSEAEDPFTTGLNVSVRREGSAHVVALRGVARLEEAEELNARLPRLIQPATPHLILDLSALEFLSSTGIGALVAAHNEARRHDGRVSVVGPQPEVAHLLHLTRVDQLITVFPTLEAARAGLAHPPE